VIRRVRVEWPDRAAFARRGDRPIRFLAASDEVDPALEHEANRASLGQLDGVIGCGDLSPEWLAFLADAFEAPLVYVRGNHDRGGGWDEEKRGAPRPLDSGRLTRVDGIPIAGLGWPGVEQRGNERHSGLAWRDALSVASRSLIARLTGRGGPLVVISHVPPAGAGDVPTDPYHVGFPAYRWLLDRLRPPVWLHGHTTTASVPALLVHAGPTTLVNVTGAVLLELVPPGSNGRGSHGRGSNGREPDAAA
jgi:Icc-related predicted phosphoesterase